MSDYHKCRVCGKKFEYKRDKRTHQEEAHNDSLVGYSENGSMQKLKGMTDALRKNDYDKKHTTTDKSTQKDLYGRKVGGKTLNDF